MVFNLVPRTFPSHFLREKPWGRGWVVLTLPYEWLFFFFAGRIVSLLRSCFPVSEFYLREVLSHNRGRVASFYQAIFEMFGYFSQKWFERCGSLEA